MDEEEALLLVLSVLMCGFGLFAGLGNAATMTFIATSPRLRKLTFGKMLFNLAVSGKFFTCHRTSESHTGLKLSI